MGQGWLSAARGRTSTEVASNARGSTLRQRAKRLLITACVGSGISLLGAASAFGQTTPIKVLVFHGPSDAVVDAGVTAITNLGTTNGFEVTDTQDAAAFTAANLAQYRAVVFLNNSGDRLNTGQEMALQGYVQAGGGFVGIGGAAEAEPGNAFITGLIGSRPDTGSPTTASQQVLVVGDRVHPATRGLDLELTREDIWYRWNPRPTGTVHTVARYRAPGASAGDGTATGGTDWPISWCRDFQGGRSFYTGMGRTAASYAQQPFQAHLLGAIQWSAGMVRGGCKATISSNYQGERIVSAASGDLTHSGEPHGVSFAPNGWGFYIGRADCRTNAERGKMVGLASPARILNFNDPNVGVGCGTIHIWDPAEANGTVNSGVTLAATLPVYGDRGSGNEINGKIEAGLLGVAVAPDFNTTGHIYLQYYPTFNPNNPVHPGLADGAERRITKMAHPRVSRFTVNKQTKKIDLDSELVVFEYDAQIYSCCHRGGGMGFDSEGNLYVTTGDSNSSQSTNGYSGNYQPARCPTGSPTEASNSHCGANNVSYNDARRTAGNTNDYNGKMLRFKPIASVADGTQPAVGVGSTYTLPTASSPNGPNLFDGTEGGGGKTKPEIYAMGLRNPSRLAIDPKTDVPYSAWVGPDAGSPSATQGPSTYESGSQIPKAGNYGWPYCMGNQQAYRDRVADGSLRTTNGPGYVSGGPASNPTNGWYDCKNLRNDSTNNTGLVELPHVTGTGMDAGTARPHTAWYSRGNPGNNNGCPDFPRELGPDSAPNYGATPTQLCPYLINSGMTTFAGPVYRYDDTASDDAVRWPKYWDGRWFLQDHGNNSAKHALLLDPAKQEDGRPIYADSFRNVLNWQANYMDSKFGPDGALYVQVYSGFFSTGSEAGMYRFTYTGGPDTPNPDPQWTSTSTARQVQFGLGASGGVSYEWDFGDDTPTSTAPTPAHTYAATGTYDAKLTVTYSDGEKVSKVVKVTVGDDAAAPTTTVQINNATPVNSYNAPVQVSLRASDGTGGTGVEWTEYRIDGGAFVRADNTESADPFVTSFNVGGNGQHTVEFRSRDRSGNTESPNGLVSFTINTGGGGAACLPQSDEFGGAALDPKWSVLRPVADNGPVVADGSLTLPTLQGDFIANDPLASNVVLQDAPEGEWTFTTKLDTAGINANGEQAGIVIWKSETPRSYSKIMAIQNNSGVDQFEHIVTQSGSVNPPISSSITPAPGGQLPEQVLLRARYTGTQVIGEFSADDGASWTKIGSESHTNPLAAPLRVGVVSFRGSQGGGTVSFDWARFHAGASANTPVTCASGCNPLSDSFDGAELDPKWELINPIAGTPMTQANGRLVVPLRQADFYGGTGNAQALLQQAPSGSWVATAKVVHAGISADGEALGLALVNNLNPNYFLKTTLQYKTDADPDTSGNQPGKWAERVLTSNGNAITLPPATVPWPNSGALTLDGDYVWVRFVYDDADKTLTTWTSTDGTSFTSFGAPISTTQYLNQPGGFRIGVFGKRDGATANKNVEIEAFNVVTGADPQTSGDDCGGSGAGCTQTDEFDGTALDSKWQVVNPVPAALAVGGGNLTLTSGVGDVRNTSFTAQNILLQDVPAGPWSVTTKLDHTAVASDGQAAGMVVYGSQNPNYFAKVAIQYKNNDLSGNPMNGIWAERALTLNGTTSSAYGGQFPNTGKLTPPTSDLWLRVSFDGTNVIQEYSLDGQSFSAIAPQFPAAELGTAGVTKIGLFVKHDNGGQAANVKFDSFSVDAASCGGGGDTVAPRTTHELEPTQPNGDAGWYKSSVKVTLSATDDGGSGLDATEYRYAGTEEWSTYTAPFTVERDGTYTIQYRSKDKAGNVESTRTVTFKIDSEAPTTTAKINGAAPVANYDGPVALDLDAVDGESASGVKATQIRIDGGDWQPYVEEEVLLDSQADLARWAQAGPGGLNWVDQDGGFARTSGGLGMPWYPGKDYGDFSLKLQFRDSGTGNNGNGGVFVRFPHPTQTAALPAGQRFPCQVGSGQSDPAWVAIYCGHEIQINDNQTSEPQKTGSVYNFSPLNATQAKVQPKNTWVDYEVRVVGQTYTMIRNGEVLQTFENTPGKQSSRAGDPPTDARQFTRGYIGLQNHGSSDQIDYRNVRILPLDAGSVRGPVTIEGDGEHTVEFRSSDNAGNQEETKTVTFRIGDEPGGDTTAPTTTHELDPAQPGAGGTYNGAVKVTFSATDPATGSGTPAPKTHDVDATPSTWSPSAVDAVVGDTVRWNFPTSAALPHDVWVIKPGESPTSQGTQIADITLAGGPSASTTVDQAGTWTFVCHVHSFESEGRWQGMVGTIDVSQPGPAPGSGVDYTEYRVDAGDWVRAANAASADPFVSSVTVSAAGQHTVEYRSADKAGNVETAKSVGFVIAEPPTGGTEVDSEITATVPLVLGLTLGTPATFAPFVPGVAQDYEASTVATVTSSARGAALSVFDRSTTSTGHLVNDDMALPQALQASGGGAFAPVGGTSNPTILRTWNGPVAAASVPVQFRQSIAASDLLLAGTYRKTVTFQVSATTP